MSKICTKCEVEKPVSEFGSSAPTSSGYNSWCKQCCRDASKRHGESPSGIYSTLKGRSKYRKNNPQRYRTYHQVNINRREFIEWYEGQAKQCAYCDIPEEHLNKIDDRYNNLYYRLVIDCMNNDEGYTKGNIVLSCSRCNSTKSDFFTYEEMVEIAQKYIKPSWMNKMRELR